MSGAELLNLLWDKGIAVVATGGRLRIEAPKGALTPDLLAEIAKYKGEVLALLGEPQSVPGWVGQSVRLEDLPDFCRRWGIRLVGLRWPEGGGPPAGEFVRVD